MLTTISNENIKDLGITLATALPVVAVAFYTVRNAEDGDHGQSPDRLSFGGHFLKLLKAPGMPWVLRRLGAESRPGSASLEVRSGWRLRSDLGFMYRAALAFLFSLGPLVLGEERRVARAMLGVALVLVVFSLNALIIYSALTAAIRDERTWPLTSPAEPPNGRGTSDTNTSGAAARARPPGNSVAIANLVGLVTGAGAVIGGLLVGLSTP